MTINGVRVEELKDTNDPRMPLGRHIEHDPRSRDFAYKSKVKMEDLKSIEHPRYGDIFSQEQGSCTGQACAGVINTWPFCDPDETTLSEEDAVEIYMLATELDKIPGTYPPTDTGSTGLGAAKAAVTKGYVPGYQHAFSLEDAVGAVQEYPVMTGVPWYEGFNTPDESGQITISGRPVGGHEFEIVGFELHDNLYDSLMLAVNSWGIVWGNKGRFNLTVATWHTLLEEGGDVTILMPE